MADKKDKDYYINQLISRQRKRIYQINIELEEIKKSKKCLNEEVSFKEENEKYTFYIKDQSDVKSDINSIKNKDIINNDNFSNHKEYSFPLSSFIDSLEQNTKFDENNEKSKSLNDKLPEFRNINLNFKYNHNDKFSDRNSIKIPKPLFHHSNNINNHERLNSPGPDNSTSEAFSKAMTNANKSIGNDNLNPSISYNISEQSYSKLRKKKMKIQDLRNQLNDRDNLINQMKTEIDNLHKNLSYYELQLTLCENENTKMKNKMENQTSINLINDREEIFLKLQNFQERNAEIEEKYENLLNNLNMKIKENDYLSQKARDFEIILEESNDSNAELIKQLKIEIDTMKKNSLIREKMIEFMIYFFNKNKIHYDESGKETVMINPNDFNLEKLQYELILLENYIFLERSESNEKKKLPKNSSQIKRESISEKILENKELEKKINGNLKVKSDEGNKTLVSYESSKTILNMNNKINSIKDESKEMITKIDSLNQLKNDNNIQWQAMYKTLEQRLNDLEKDLTRKSGIQHISSENVTIEKLSGKLIDTRGQVKSNSITTSSKKINDSIELKNEGNDNPLKIKKSNKIKNKKRKNIPPLEKKKI